jgi:hypothetical protein
LLNAPGLVLQVEHIYDIRSVLSATHGISAERYVVLGAFRLVDHNFFLTSGSSCGDTGLPDFLEIFRYLEDLISVFIFFVEPVGALGGVTEVNLGSVVSD